MQKDKQLTPKLVTAIISAGIMAFAGVVAETAMNITFPTLMREFEIGTPGSAGVPPCSGLPQVIC